MTSSTICAILTLNPKPSPERDPIGLADGEGSQSEFRALAITNSVERISMFKLPNSYLEHPIYRLSNAILIPFLGTSVYHYIHQ